MRWRTAWALAGIFAGLPAHAAPAVAEMNFTILGLDAALGQTFAERFAVRLRAEGVAVTTQRDVASLLSMERQRQLLGCKDDSASCLTELAGALGAKVVITGQVGRVGSQVSLAVKALDVGRSQVIYTLAVVVADEGEALERLERAAPEAAERLKVVLNGGEVATAPGRSSPAGPWVLSATGAAGAGAGIALLVYAQVLSGHVAGAPISGTPPSVVDAWAAQTSQLRLVGGLCLGIGAAAVASGVLWEVLRAPGPAVTVSVGPAGVQVGLAGRF